jgi:hemolysin III
LGTFGPRRAGRDLLAFREPINAWTHGVWFLLSLPATVLLWRAGRGDRAKQVSLLVFGLGLVSCFAGSTLFHGVRLPDDHVTLFAQLDYIGIFLLIAGSYTPAVFTLMRGANKWGTLATVWLLAATGIALRVLAVPIPSTVSTGLYLVMGWSVVFCYCAFVRVLSHRALVPIPLGGLFYSIGAVCNLVHWPALWPGVFSTHELWHLFVMAGSLAHYWFMFRCVVPFDRRGLAAVPDEEPDETAEPAAAAEPVEAGA